MINRQMQYFKLYVNEPVLGGYGQKEDKFILLDTIEVAINFSAINKKNEDIRYKDCDYIGLTSYKGLDIGKEYKLVGDREYLIKSINEIGRLSQYLLKVVI